MDDDKYSASIARIEAHRARRVAEMLVLSDSPEYADQPEEMLVDLSNLNASEVMAEYRRRHAKFGTTPFDPEGKILRLFPGGITIWSGHPGQGKTTFLRQLVCHILKRGSSVFLASLEEHPHDTLVRIAATAAGRSEPTDDDLAWFMDAYAKRFRLWGFVGVADHLRLLSAVRKLADQGIRHAVIDSLMRLDVSNRDLDAQKSFANLIAATAQTSKCHIHLVAHPRKLISAEQELDLNDVAGAKEFGCVADNVIFVRRGKTERQFVDEQASPMVLSIKKQRHHDGGIRDVVGWLHKRFRQFHVDQYASEPTNYLPEDAIKYLRTADAAAVAKESQ
jgi:KaiC/GvpD/RAD55 family RecA-like ATPase